MKEGFENKEKTTQTNTKIIKKYLPNLTNNKPYKRDESESEAVVAQYPDFFKHSTEIIEKEEITKEFEKIFEEKKNYQKDNPQIVKIVLNNRNYTKNCKIRTEEMGQRKYIYVQVDGSNTIRQFKQQEHEDGTYTYAYSMTTSQERIAVTYSNDNASGNESDVSINNSKRCIINNLHAIHELDEGNYKFTDPSS